MTVTIFFFLRDLMTETIGFIFCRASFFKVIYMLFDGQDFSIKLILFAVCYGVLGNNGATRCGVIRRRAQGWCVIEKGIFLKVGEMLNIAGRPVTRLTMLQALSDGQN